MVVAALCGSAFIALFARFSPTCAPLAWIAAAPLFAAIYRFRPLAAAGAGCVWGGCFAAMLSAIYFDGPREAGMRFGVTAGLLAAYAGGAAALRRQLGFAPLLLAVLWACLELALSMTTAQVPGGVLSVGTHGGGLLTSTGHLLGYVIVACLVAYINAGFVRVLDAATERLAAPAGRTVRSAPAAPAALLAVDDFVLRLWSRLRPLLPRGPPRGAVIASRVFCS
ncbi:Apolipoprotein N-acyltransferase [Phycisphaerae bacterium RAS1]|nr:Apolipoprotein N-acyltransferase [Phycisphaerae bacterium RAS1]